MGRLRAIAIKEFWAILRDPRGRIVLFVPPIIQLLIFSFASTLEVKNFDVGVLDRSGGRGAIELVAQIAGSPNVGHVIRLNSNDEMREAINRRKIIGALIIQPGFDADLARGHASAGLVLDGRRSNAAQIVSGYLQRIAANTGATLRPATANRPPGTVVRHWFNPNLDYIWFTIPSLQVIIAATAVLAVSAQAVARERELGTFDQLMVSPLRVHEILIGKMAPPVIIGLINGTIFVLAGVFVFGVPFHGSLLLLYLALFFYLMALVGVGMFISALTQTQQQAFLGMFLVAVPTIILSGYASPIENMPYWLQILSLGNPARHFLVITEGLYLKDMPASDVFANTLPLVIISAITTGLAAWLFRARME